MGSTVDREVGLDQEEAGLYQARFNFSIHYFLLCFKSEGWWLFNKKLQIISFAKILFLFYILFCIKQVAKLVE